MQEFFPASLRRSDVRSSISEHASSGLILTRSTISSSSPTSHGSRARDGQFFGKEDAVMRALAKVEDFDPHDLQRTASTRANATCLSPWVVCLLDHEIGGVAGTYNRHEYVEQKRYMAYAIENEVREAFGMKPIAMPPRPLA